MTIKYHNPDIVGKPAGPYTHMVETEDYVFLSGQAPIDIHSGKVFSGTFEEEAVMVFDNIKKILGYVNLQLTDIVKVNAYLGDLKYRDEYNQLYKQYFTPPYPARTTIGCLLGGIKIEIDVIAYKNKSES